MAQKDKRMTSFWTPNCHDFPETKELRPSKSCREKSLKSQNLDFVTTLMTMKVIRTKTEQFL